MRSPRANHIRSRYLVAKKCGGPPNQKGSHCFRSAGSLQSERSNSQTQRKIFGFAKRASEIRNPVGPKNVCLHGLTRFERDALKMSPLQHQNCPLRRFGATELNPVMTDAGPTELQYFQPLGITADARALSRRSSLNPLVWPGRRKRTVERITAGLTHQRHQAARPFLYTKRVQILPHSEALCTRQT